MKHLFYLIILLFLPISIYSQIEDITRLPVQNPSQSIKESAPVWISENEIMIFYVSPTLDTIYSTKSNDRGITWQEPKVVQLVELVTTQDLLYLTALRSNTGRILLAWSVRAESMKLIYSNDDGVNWSEPVEILGGGTIPVFRKSNEFLNLTQFETGEILLSFNPFYGTFLPYYKTSHDDGITWSEEAVEFPGMTGFTIRDLTIISVGRNSLLGVFQFRKENNDGIYSRLSTDGGNSWSDTVSIVNNPLNETRPKVIKAEDGSIQLIYLIENKSGFENYKQNDIYLLESTDSGISWIEDRRFTHYIGDDKFINISGRDNKILLSIATERFTNDYQISFGILGETEEISTPPKVLELGITEIDYVNKQFALNATVIDDENVDKVEVMFDETLDYDELFDDGAHNDLDSGDNVYGNIFNFVKPGANKSFMMDVNKIELPFSNKGILADVRVDVTSPIKLNAYDINNYFISKKDTISYTFGSGARFEEGTFLFSGGFYLSGYSNGDLWANAVASASLVEDYLPGLVGGDPESSLNNIYVVYNDDIPFGYSWQRWKDAVTLGAEFYDGNADGVYNPTDKNWNGTWDPNEGRCCWL
jgi:hypothetical protein